MDSGKRTHKTWVFSQVRCVVSFRASRAAPHTRPRVLSLSLLRVRRVRSHASRARHNTRRAFDFHVATRSRSGAERCPPRTRSRRWRPPGAWRRARARGPSTSAARRPGRRSTRRDRRFRGPASGPEPAGAGDRSRAGVGTRAWRRASPPAASPTRAADKRMRAQMEDEDLNTLVSGLPFRTSTTATSPRTASRCRSSTWRNSRMPATTTPLYYDPGLIAQYWSKARRDYAGRAAPRQRRVHLWRHQRRR